jgi:hypothetical protein
VKFVVLVEQVPELTLRVDFIAKNYPAIRFASHFKRKRESFFLSENKNPRR